MALHEHFHAGLDYFTDEHLALALTLYREPELVRAVVAAGRVGDAAERVVVQLDDRPLGERVIVTRSGAFVGCLAVDMAGGGLPVADRAAMLSVLAQRDAEAERRRDFGAQTTGDQAAALKRLRTAGHTLTREEFGAAKPVVELMPLVFASHLVKAFGAYDKSYSALSVLRWGTEVASATTRKAWDEVWYMFHLTALLAAASEPLSAALDELDDRQRDAMVSTLASATQAGPLSGLARSVNALARLARPLLPSLARAMSTATPFPSFLCSVGALQGLVEAGSERAPAALAALSAPPLEATPGLDVTENYYRSVRRFVLGAIEADAKRAREGTPRHEETRRMAHLMLLDGPLAARFADAAALSEQSVTLGSANCRWSAFQLNGVKWQCQLAHRWTVADPEHFYPVADEREALRPRRFEAEWLWEMVGHREKIWAPRGPTVRKADAPGRNDPCSCGSGKKFKKCCGA